VIKTSLAKEDTVAVSSSIKVYYWTASHDNVSWL